MIILVIDPAPRAGLFSGCVGGKLIVRSRQPFLDGARALFARGYDAVQHTARKFGHSVIRYNAHLTNSHCDTICSPLAECGLSR
jgi:hypothetical protein